MRVAADDTWADVFSRVIVEKIEPNLGIGRATILDEYPVSEAALARPTAHDPRVAERFELYVCGVEIANAFGELTDAAEQRRRFEAEMAEKERVHGERYPLDEDFLAALAQCRRHPASRLASTGWSCWRPARSVSSRCCGRRCRSAVRQRTMTIRLPSELVAAGLAPPEKLADLARVAERYAVAITPAIAGLIDRSDPQRSDRAAVRARHRRTHHQRRRSVPIRSATMRIRRSKESCTAIRIACC